MYLKDPKKVKQKDQAANGSLELKRNLHSVFQGSLAERAHANGNLRICGLKEMIIVKSIVLASLTSPYAVHISC